MSATTTSGYQAYFISVNTLLCAFSEDAQLMLCKGYLGWEFPTNRLLQRLPLAKYSAFNIIMWGLVLALFATTENFGGAVVIRLFLGVFEAAVTPGFTLFVSQV